MPLNSCCFFSVNVGPGWPICAQRWSKTSFISFFFSVNLFNFYRVSTLKIIIFSFFVHICLTYELLNILRIVQRLTDVLGQHGLSSVNKYNVGASAEKERVPYSNSARAGVCDIVIVAAHSQPFKRFKCVDCAVLPPSYSTEHYEQPLKSSGQSPNIGLPFVTVLLPCVAINVNQ